MIDGTLALSTYTKEVNGVKLPTTRPVLKLTSFHLCGKKPKKTQFDEPRELAASQT